MFLDWVYVSTLHVQYSVAPRGIRRGNLRSIFEHVDVGWLVIANKSAGVDPLSRCCWYLGCQDVEAVDRQVPPPFQRFVAPTDSRRKIL